MCLILCGAWWYVVGPAKATVRRAHPEWGYVEHVFMRVPAVYNRADVKSLVESGDHHIYITNERGHLMLTIYVEHVSFTLLPLSSVTHVNASSGPLRQDTASCCRPHTSLTD